MEGLPIDLVRIDSDAQPRLDVSSSVVAEYAEAMADGDKFPPIVVFHDGQIYWLADGFHRVKAAQAAQIGELDADIRKGDKRDAVLFSVGCNAIHGLRRTPQDKRAAVRKLLNDPEWSQWSDREIARRCRVSNRFVSNIRPNTVNVHSTDRTFVHHRTGKPTKMDTANIGSNQRRGVDLPTGVKASRKILRNGDKVQDIAPFPEAVTAPQEPERAQYDESGRLIYHPWPEEKREQQRRMSDFTMYFIDNLKLIADQLQEPVCDLVLPEDREEVGQLLKRVETRLNNVHSTWSEHYGT